MDCAVRRLLRTSLKKVTGSRVTKNHKSGVAAAVGVCSNQGVADKLLGDSGGFTI